MARNTRGKILWPTIFQSGSLLMGFPLAWLFCWLGWGVYSVGAALFISMFSCSAWRIWFARRLVSMSAWYWVNRTLLPFLFATVISAAIALIPRMFMLPSFWRILVTGFLCDTILFVLAWFFILDENEREYLKGHVGRLFNKFKSKTN